jgi:predicted RNase H-like nuclease
LGIAARVFTSKQLTVWGVYFVGVDLAWGERSPTGVAALDGEGALCHVGVAGDDADVLAHLNPYLSGPCVVAIDAPLVVTNPSGNRPCEAALNRDFRRFDAGAHPANTGLPWFADGGRGARLCAALDLDLDPRSAAPRRALEVYPHAASVVLFGLDKTLKYKQKQGREFTSLRSELLRLMDFVEGLRSAMPTLSTAGTAWNSLRDNVVTATRKSALRRAEDPVDAVLCAYIARFVAHRPDDVTVYGDPVTGCIVTPTLPTSASSR